MHVARAQHAEVAAVEGCELCLVEPFDYRKDRCVDEANVGVLVATAEVPDAVEVASEKAFDPIGALDDVFQEVDPDLRMCALVNEVVDFRENGQGDDEFLVAHLQ